MDPHATFAVVSPGRLMLSQAPAAELAAVALDAKRELELAPGSDPPAFIIIAVPPAAPEDLEALGARAVAAIRRNDLAEVELEAARAQDA